MATVVISMHALAQADYGYQSLTDDPNCVRVAGLSDFQGLA